jgi:hypothetical protein
MAFLKKKLIRIVKCMYTNNECALITSSGTFEWFEIKFGVKQGISGFLFLIVIYWVTKNSTKDNNGD